MYFKTIMIIASICTLMTYPQIAMTQVKPITELKIVKEALSEEESAQYRSGRKSPSGAYRIERGKTGYTVVDNNTNYKHIPDVPGKVRKISWPKNEDRIAFDVSMIPVGNRKYTGAVGVYFFEDKSTKIFRPDDYLLMNSRISPDGTMILCTGSGYTNGYIIVIDIETGELKIITDIVSSRPSWVPNSEKVVFVQYVDDRHQKIVSADLETGEKVEIIKSLYSIRFAISPDGKRILFSSHEDHQRKLYVIDIDGSNLREITSIHISGLFSQRWSPGGRYISYERPVIRGHHERTVSSEIYIYDLNTKTERQLTDNPGTIHKVIKWGTDNRIVIKAETNEVSTYETYKLVQ